MTTASVGRAPDVPLVAVAPTSRTSAVDDRALPTRAGRSLASYLALPRPGDLGKAVIVPCAFLFGTVVTGGMTTTRLWHAVVVWLVLELLVYQARYQWNDIRGFHADQRHPDSASRGRLPGPVEQAVPHIAASLAVAVARLGGAALVALVIPGIRMTVVAMTVGVFGAAVIYESLRSLATGRGTSRMPVPISPALGALWVAVGAGYTVRGMTGLALAVDLGHRTGAAVAAAVAMWALGVMFVTCRWALEALCFAKFQAGQPTQGRSLEVIWHLPEGGAREHSLGLARWLPTTAEGADDGPATPKQWRALSSGGPARAPWNLAFFLAATMATVAGRMLAAPVDGGALAAALAVGAAVAGIVVVTPKLRRGMAAGLGAALVVAWGMGTSSPWLAAGVGCLVVVAAYDCFTGQCTDEIGKVVRERLRRVRA